MRYPTTGFTADKIMVSAYLVAGLSEGDPTARDFAELVLVPTHVPPLVTAITEGLTVPVGHVVHVIMLGGLRHQDPFENG